jgi:hypothetical protein
LEAVKESVVTFLGAEEDWSRSIVFRLKRKKTTATATTKNARNGAKVNARRFERETSERR